MKKHTFISYLL